MARKKGYNSKGKDKIFKQFLYKEKMSFSEIHKKTKIRSNLLAYFLKKMCLEGTLIKSNDYYLLSEKGEKLIPFYTDTESQNPLVVLLIPIIKNGRILLIKREKRPYKGLWSLVSGRMLLSEGLFEGAERICQKKVMAKCKPESICSVIHERLVEKYTKHSFVFFVIRVKPLEETLEHDSLKWFDLNKVPKSKTISSDYWVIKNKLSDNIEVIEEVLSKDGKKMNLI